MNEPKPLYRCDLCKSVDYQDDVIGCKRCGFDEMKPIAQPQPEPASKGVTHQWRKKGTGPWWDGYPDHSDGDGPYETRTLYANPNEPVEVSKLAVYYYWTPKPETGWPTNLATWSQNPGPHKDWDVVAYVTLESANAAISSQQRETQEAAEVSALLVAALDRYLRQDETANDTDNGVYREGVRAMQAAVSAPQEAGKAEAQLLDEWASACGRVSSLTSGLRSDLLQLIRSARESKEAGKVEAVADEPYHWIWSFLDGSAGYMGVWFGDKHPDHPGKYWWRPFLKQARDELKLYLRPSQQALGDPTIAKALAAWFNDDGNGTFEERMRRAILAAAGGSEK